MAKSAAPTSHSLSDAAIESLAARLDRLIAAIERISPPPAPPTDLSGADAFVWHARDKRLVPVPRVNRVDLSLLYGIDRVRDLLLQNTLRFARGLPANNALLWGARGMGKSSLVKAAHAAVNDHFRGRADPLKLIEIHREDIETFPEVMALIAPQPHRFILFSDDLSFEVSDTSYKSLKAALEGGLEGRPENILLYATSNRRHLMPRDMIENESSTAIHPSEGVEEKVSLSDRFGLWLGFHNCSQPDYLAMVEGYVDHFGLGVPPEELRADALEWAATRGARSGRVAWQYIQDLAGRLGVNLAETQSAEASGASADESLPARPEEDERPLESAQAPLR
jgi:predicted AAA+ superfamily ATPase